MKGSIAVRFSELFADTVEAHGFEWARCYYAKHGVTAWEFDFWLRSYLSNLVTF